MNIKLTEFENDLRSNFPSGERRGNFNIPEVDHRGYRKIVFCRSMVIESVEVYS